jgi:DNA-binding IclR family transcriptional regulator
MSIVKSAQRVLEILEFLRQLKPSTVGDISHALHMPNSSTSVLLKSLVTMGYVDFNPETRQFKPSYRVALLGEQVDERSTLGDSAFTEKLRALHEQTGQTVIVGLQNGAYVQYVHVLAATKKLMERLPVGKLRLMSYNPLGEALLAKLDDKRATLIIRHNNANWPDRATRLSEDAHWLRIKLVRANGYCEGTGRTWPQAKIIAMAISLKADMPRLSVGVGGIGETTPRQREHIIAALRELSASAAPTHPRAPAGARAEMPFRNEGRHSTDVS